MLIDGLLFRTAKSSKKTINVEKQNDLERDLKENQIVCETNTKLIKALFSYLQDNDLQQLSKSVQAIDEERKDEIFKNNQKYVRIPH